VKRDTPLLPRCLIADDHPALLVAVADFLSANGFDIVATANDGLSAVEAAKTLKPDVALIDFRMPRLAGLELLKQLQAEAPATRIAIYTADADRDLVRSALAAGATAVVLKEAPLLDLLRALQSALRGRPYVDPVLGRAAFEGRQRTGGPLTQRESEVLLLVAEGMSHDEIGKELNIGAETVRTHVQKARTRLGASNRTHAVATALRLGLIA
jgi:DNA-binding NarL/FixJ family response regulator